MTNREKIEVLIAEELDSANEKFPLFASDHEAYAVMLEEFEESKEDIDLVTYGMKELWGNIRRDDFETDILCSGIKTSAIHAIMELIQLAAMADKAIESRKARENGKNICD